MMMNYRNAAYTAYGWIDCEIEHPQLGWIPFTASNVEGQDTKDLFDTIVAESNVAPYEPPPEPTPEERRAALPNLYPAEFRNGLIDAGFMPADIETAIKEMGLSPKDEAKALTKWEYALEIERMHPLVQALAPSLGLTDEQVDAMWQAQLDARQLRLHRLGR